MDNKLALVLAGHGTITEKNADSLLDLNMPDDVSPFAVGRINRQQKGLKTALGWFENEELDVERVDDPIAKLKEYKSKKGWDAHLVMVPDFDHEEDLKLMDAAHEAGITVKDLTGGYDDILPEEKPVEEAAAVETAGLVNSLPGPGNLVSEEWAVLKSFAQHLLSYGTTSVEVSEAEANRKAIEDAPFDGGEVVGSATKKPGTTAFLMNEDGHYRKAEGRRKKSDEVRVWLTDDEVAQLPRAVYDPPEDD